MWQSYLENKTSGAMRMYWVYGPDQKDITIIGLEPHSEDKKMVHTTEFHCQICRIKLNMELKHEQLVYEKNRVAAFFMPKRRCRVWDMHVKM